jgi:hypothetical protein
MFDFLQNLSDWFTSGIYSWFEEAMIYAMQSLMIFFIKMKLFGLRFAWGIAESVLTNLNVFSTIQTLWGSVPGDMYAMLNFFNVPKAVNLLLTAVGTRFVFRFIPFL